MSLKRERDEDIAEEVQPSPKHARRDLPSTPSVVPDAEQIAALRSFLAPLLNPTTLVIPDVHTCFFLFNGYGNTEHNVPPLLKDMSLVYLNGVVLAQVSQGSQLQRETLWSILEPLIDPSIPVVLKQKSVDTGHHKAENFVLRPSKDGSIENLLTGSEYGLKLQLHIMEGLDFGVHLDMSEGRKWMRQNSRGLRVCNLFSYTGGLGVAALLGDAILVENVDNSSSALTTGKINSELNGFVNDRRIRFTKMDVNKYIKMKVKKSIERFDLVIVDPSPPPKFHKTSEDKIIKFYIPLAAKAMKILTGEGRLLISCHSKDVEESDFVAQMTGRLSLELTERIPYPERMGITRAKLWVFKKMPPSESVSLVPQSDEINCLEPSPDDNEQ